MKPPKRLYHPGKLSHRAEARLHRYWHAEALRRDAAGHLWALSLKPSGDGRLPPWWAFCGTLRDCELAAGPINPRCNRCHFHCREFAHPEGLCRECADQT